MAQQNPMMQRAKEMVQGKSEEELKQIANNLCSQRGIDLQQAMNSFRNQLGI